MMIADPNDDTEWNDILRQKGILPPKQVEPVEEPPSPPDPVVQLDQLTVDQLTKRLELLEDDGIDDEDAKFMKEYRQKRIDMLRQEAARAKFGHVLEVSKSDWKTAVSELDDVYVIIHVSQRGHLLCNTVDEYLVELARRFPMVKFLRGECALCIPNYPECNLPSLLIYKGGDLKHQLIGPQAVGGKSVTAKSLELRLAQLGVVESELTEDSIKRIHVSSVYNRATHRIGRLDHEEEKSDSD